MCGINGFSWVDQALIRKMNQTSCHRGPDEERVFVDNNVSLGHRRLSIIDLSPAGHQPMCNEDGTIWIVHNGEIYNYPEIRMELQAKGYKLVSRTDTEVILHSYEEGGTNCLSRLNGMWAFAIWDGRLK